MNEICIWTPKNFEESGYRLHNIDKQLHDGLLLKKEVAIKKKTTMIILSCLSSNSQYTSQVHQINGKS